MKASPLPSDLNISSALWPRSWILSGASAEPSNTSWNILAASAGPDALSIAAITPWYWGVLLISCNRYSNWVAISEVLVPLALAKSTNPCCLDL